MNRPHILLATPWVRRLSALASGLCMLVLIGSPGAQAACSTGTTLAVGACPALPAPGCCASATVVQWCEGGDWCQLDCSESVADNDSCQVDYTNSCCDRCGTPKDNTALCQCDPACEAFNDCCPDYDAQCGGQGQAFCGWTVEATFQGYDCAPSPAIEPTGTYPYTCEADQAVECSCDGKACGDDGCGGSCGTCDVGATCLAGQCLCAGSCIGKTCGDDGCGNVCGECAPGQACVEGQCQGACVPDCSGLLCGDDGCGGSCGVCPEGQACSALGTCEEGCAPDCGGKACGDDGCGGSCGSCLETEQCGASGQCESACEADCLGKQCGDDGCGGSCGSCPQGSCQENLCVAGCTGSCEGKVCGPDGCGGSCGGCPEGEACDAQGLCAPGCEPECTARECGEDGCGGSCGVCSEGAYCAPEGLCVDSTEADASVTTPEENCPSGSYWNALVGECVADDGTNLAVNSGAGSDGGCGGTRSPLSSVLLALALLAWWRAPRFRWPSP